MNRPLWIRCWRPTAPFTPLPATFIIARWLTARRGGLSHARADRHREALRKHILAAATRAPELTTRQAWDPVLARISTASNGTVSRTQALALDGTAGRQLIHFRLPRTAFDLRIQLNPATRPNTYPVWLTALW